MFQLPRRRPLRQRLSKTYISFKFQQENLDSSTTETTIEEDNAATTAERTRVEVEATIAIRNHQEEEEAQAQVQEDDILHMSLKIIEIFKPSQIYDIIYVIHILMSTSD
jgi:hypothetical protein